jgi:hypothetical protein
MLNLEPIADILRRISPLVPNDASHAGAYSSHADQSLKDRAFPRPAIASLSKNRQFHALPRIGEIGREGRELLQFKVRH